MLEGCCIGTEAVEDKDQGGLVQGEEGQKDLGGGDKGHGRNHNTRGHEENMEQTQGS